MGLLKVLKGIFALLGFLVLVAVGLGAYLWFTDYEVEAEVTGKGQDANGPYVVITPRLVPTEVKHSLTSDQASFVCVGYQVKYRIQTERFQVFDDRGVLVYDSVEGLQNTQAALRCGASNTGGGLFALG